MKNEISLLATPDYRRFIEDIKTLVSAARMSAARHVNRDLILLYWDIGKTIDHKQRLLGWGEFVIDRISDELRASFPSTTGFSPRNLRYMKQFYLAYTDMAIWQQPVAKLMKSTIPGYLRQPVAKLSHHDKCFHDGSVLSDVEITLFLQQLVAEIPWGHNLLILNKLTDPVARIWYLQATARTGWSRNVLLNQIRVGAYERAIIDKKTHNFEQALPEHLAEQADEMLKSSYNLEFLGIRRAVTERALEDRLIERLRDFILELGYGFCFIGRQYRLTLGNKEYFIDLLFYHRFLKALVAFELKAGAFEPEYAGKMDFYLNLLNDKERDPDDQPSIGVILCAEKDDVEVEYALRTKANPIGVATYEFQSKLPAEMKGKLPTARQLCAMVRSVLPDAKGVGK
jgi:predicted nuclease of restriction endonuclease-like (RecB) superfamily